MIETKTKLIDGLSFTTTQLPPLKAYPLSARVANILLPALTKFLATDMKGGDVTSFLAQDASKLMPALEPLLEALSKKENEDLPLKLLVGTSVQVPDDNGQMSVLSLASPEAFNRAFQGRGLTLYKAMWFAIEVNFSDFFAGAFKGAQNSKESAPAEKASESAS